LRPLRRTATVVLAAATATLGAAGPAGAVHQSHHGAFVGQTEQEERLVMRVASHTRVGIRVRWRAKCESGVIVRVTRFRDVPVDRDGRFFARRAFGVGVRGKIGFDPQGNPAFPAPFSFENNEAKGRLRAVVTVAGHGRCSSGLVTWDARR
jgi:hypothetical protein